MNYYNFTCLFEKCFFHKRIIEATQCEIRNHFKKQHDYTELLEKALEFGFIESISERRSPDWLADRFFEFSTNEVEQTWI